MKKPLNRDAWLRYKLRGLSLQWPPRSEAIKFARVSRGLYRCAICKREDVPNKEKQLDHIDPVVDLKNTSKKFEITLEYIQKLFPQTHQEFQVLCSSCHMVKTGTENAMRKFYKGKKSES